MSLPSSPNFSFSPSAFDLRKRKLEDYSSAAAFDDDDAFNFFSSNVNSVRMRRDEILSSEEETPPPPWSVVHSSFIPAAVDADGSDHSTSSSSSTTVQSSATLDRPSEPSSSCQLQFFIRMLSGSGNIVVRANSDDTVMSLHEMIESAYRIPVTEQGLIYRGKQLQWEKSLADYAIEKDSELRLICRMRSTKQPRACQLIDDMISLVYTLQRSNSSCTPHDIKKLSRMVDEFFSSSDDDNDAMIGNLQLFSESSAPAFLVMLYGSKIEGNKDCADSVIRNFLSCCRREVGKPFYSDCASIVLEFCNLLKRIVSEEDLLYVHCRSNLGSFVDSLGVSRTLYKFGDAKEEAEGVILMQDVFPFLHELATKLSKNLVEWSGLGPSADDVTDFAAFLRPIHSLITNHVVCPISVPVNERDFYLDSCVKEIRELHNIFDELLMQMDKCLMRVENLLSVKPNGAPESPQSRCTQYLAILKLLNDIAELYKGAGQRFWNILRMRKANLSVLIIRYAKRTDDNLWLLQHKEVSNFEARRHLATLLLPDVKEDYEEIHEMLIDRSQLLAESFEYIVNAETEALHGGLFMEFKNEEATGPGVLREWFFLVAQELFNQQNALFLACPNDRRRFFPNPASSVNHMHLKYYTFSGRVIALALMHKVQVGAAFDRVFLLQLAGMEISLEDIRDADPFLYNSCNQILQMDAEFVDADGLGLTFVREVEELGSKRIVELCHGGKNIAVNSKNREQYINLLIQHCFVTSMSEQISHFAQGFSDILSKPKFLKIFFQSLELEDLDFMLCGSESSICVQDWKAHTEYCGYKETDPQISWFWKIVEEMPVEQRKVLLFFWASVKYLPVEGFCGLASKLNIHRSLEPDDRLPSSHTCFYQLCFPPYPSMSIMRDRLHIITQEHIGCSFGTC